MKNVMQYLTIITFLILPATLFAATTPVTSCGTVIGTSGTYELAANLNCPSGGYGVSILTDKVTLLLNGYTITGGGTTGNNAGVLVGEYTSVEILGPGTITNFPTGVYFAGAVDSGLVGATLTQNDTAIGVANGSSGPSNSLTITQNACSSGSVGVYVTGMTHSRVTGNICSGGFAGIEVWNGSDNSFEGNVVSNTANGGAGFLVLGGSGNNILGNQFYSNSVGIDNESTGNHYQANLLFGNSEYDILEVPSNCKGDSFKIDVFSTANQSCVK